MSLSDDCWSLVFERCSFITKQRLKLVNWQFRNILNQDYHKQLEINQLLSGKNHDQLCHELVKLYFAIDEVFINQLARSNVEDYISSLIYSRPEYIKLNPILLTPEETQTRQQKAIDKKIQNKQLTDDEHRRRVNDKKKYMLSMTVAEKMTIIKKSQKINANAKAPLIHHNLSKEKLTRLFQEYIAYKRFIGDCFECSYELHQKKLDKFYQVLQKYLLPQHALEVIKITNCVFDMKYLSFLPKRVESDNTYITIVLNPLFNYIWFFIIRDMQKKRVFVDEPLVLTPPKF